MRGSRVNALERLATEAAAKLGDLVAAGEEIPYDVLESADGSSLPRYTPLTATFVEGHAEAIRSLPAFAAAGAALGDDGAARYLERVEKPVPMEADERRDRALISFLARLFSESSEFDLDPERLAEAVEEVVGEGPQEPGEAEIAVPIAGLQLPVERLELPGATLVRADLGDVPPEARTSERSGSAPWEPVFLALIRIPRDAEAGLGNGALSAALGRMLTALRLFKAGGVAAGPSAWVGAGDDRWRRVSTGAPRPRAGGYRLAESELGNVVDLARAIAEHPQRIDSLERALARFEAGLGRGTALESLNDHLLALRFMLEGDGPARTGLPMRAAALVAEPEERDRVRLMVERALALERELWSGEPASRGAEAQTPAQVAAEIEELARRILRDVARGRFGTDLRAAADEALLGEGLAIGEGSPSEIGETSEWDLVTGAPASEPEPEEPEPEEPDREPGWLEEIGADAAETLEWPRRGGEPSGPVDAGSSRRRTADEGAIAQRLSYLFPRAETEWSVRELDYDRRRARPAPTRELVGARAAS